MVAQIKNLAKVKDPFARFSFISPLAAFPVSE